MSGLAWPSSCRDLSLSSLAQRKGIGGFSFRVSATLRVKDTDSASKGVSEKDGQATKVSEDLGRAMRQAQFSGHVKLRSHRKEAPNDILHNLAKIVAIRVASEHLATDEDVMRVVRESGLRVEVRSMNMVVWQLGQMQNCQAATKAFRAFRSAGVEPNAYVCTTLIAALGYVSLAIVSMH